jgi:hypothetical protein
MVKPVMLNLKNLLVIYVTWGFLITNLFAAWFNNYSLIFIAVRDLWIFIFFIILVKEHQYKYVFFLICLLLIGAVSFIELGFNQKTILVYAYGARDLFLIFFIFYFLKTNTSNLYITHTYFFLLTTAILAIGQIMSQIFDFENFYMALFKTHDYFTSKGIDSNLNGGILGERISTPFYSPALVCTMFTLLLFNKFSFFKKLRIGL